MNRKGIVLIKFVIFTLITILIVLSGQRMSYGQNLNVGESRTVRMIYFLPNDRPFRQEVVNSMRAAIRYAQTFYAEQMQAHGYGNKTFQFEIDAQGEPLVHRVDGRLPDSHYGYTAGKVAPGQEIVDNQNLSSNLRLTVYDVSGAQFAAGGRIGKNNSGAEYSSEIILAASKSASESLYSGEYNFYVVIHELGHAFGLGHDWRDGSYVMSYGPPGWNRLSACAAEFLAVHPYFNPDIPVKDGPPPTIELISSLGYSAGSTSVPVRLKVSDSDGIHQVILFAQGGLKLCKVLNGEQEATVEFAYDGIISPATDPNRIGTSLSNPLVHSIEVEAVDVSGDVGYTSFELFDVSTRHNHIATFQEHTDRVASVAFSPDGTLLASGSWDRTLKLWDVATRQNIDTLEGQKGINSVAFSPDGTLLASGADDKVELWDVATRQSIAMLEGQRRVNAVAFSSDGTLLASGSGDGTLKLWDVATRQNIDTLKGHTAISAVAFSRDGTLASGGSDGDKTVKLWDVATRTNITTLGGQGWVSAVSAVAFSPDGTTLAFGGAFSWINIELLDVATRTNIATLEGHRSNVLSIAYSPDGATLASASIDSTVRLWNIATRRNIATFSGIGEIQSVAFSPDGTILASGAEDGTVSLWDVGSILTPETESVSEGASTPFLREPNLPVGYGYTDAILDAGVSRAFTLSAARNFYITSIAYISDEIVVYSSTRDNDAVRVWDIAKDELIATLDGHRGDVTSLAYLPDSPDGSILASGSKDNTIRLWKRNGNNWTSTSISGHKDDVTSLVYLSGSPGGYTFASGDADGKVHLWKWSGNNIGWDGIRFNWDRDEVRSLTYSSASKTLASGSFEEIILSKWNESENRWKSARQPGARQPGNSGATGALAYSSDGETLAMGTDTPTPGTVILDEGKTTRELKLPDGGHHEPISSLAYSPNGTTLASGSDRYRRRYRSSDGIGALILTDTTTLQSIKLLKEANVTSLAYSPNGTTFASGRRSAAEPISHAVHVWDLAPSPSDIDIEIPDEMVSDVAFGKNSTYFILTPKFAKVTRFGNDTAVDYGDCRMTLHFPKRSKFFLMPLQTLAAQGDAKVKAAQANLEVTVGTGLLGNVPGIGWTFSLLKVAESGLNYLDAVAAFEKAAAAEALGQVQITSVPGRGPSGYPDSQEIPFVVLIESQSGKKITGIEFTIEQDYKKGENSYTTVARGKWDLESLSPAAPNARPVTLSDYPPFQLLPPEVQEYLLRHFGALATAEAWQIPEKTSLLPNYPNPFNPETWLPYQLSEPADVALTIYDINGRVVRDLDLGHQRAGVYQNRSRAAYWDGKNAQGEPVASGVYFYTLTAGDFTATRKMLIRK